MVQSLLSSTATMNLRSMSINSNNGTIDSPTESTESDAIAFQKIPLTALSKRTLRKLSLLLNSKKILRSEEGYERDWRGLATLAKQKFLCDESLISGDPIRKVIQFWCINNPKTATFAYLEQFLGIIDRWDVSDDIYENLVEDTKTYQEKFQICLHLSSDENIDINSANDCDYFGYGSDPNILTASDVICAQKGLPPQMYDAFVLYADADLNHVSEILTKLEDNPKYNFKLCIKDRDLLGGVQFEHIALTQLIEERCKHLIVILTEEFLRSSANKFLVNYTQALQIQHKTRKIVPLLYEESVDIPRTLKIYTHLRYNPDTATLFNFWSKLADSIQSLNGTVGTIDASPSSYKNDFNRISTADQMTLNTAMCQVKIYSSPPTEVPSISIIPPDENENPNKKDSLKLKALQMRTNINKYKQSYNSVLRSAHSTGHLNSSYQTKNPTSMSNLSTASINNETKNKKKWSSKILKKVFSRSSSKLQVAS